MYRKGVQHIVTGISALILLAGIAGCGNQPLFDEMTESRLRVVIKGTFESNDPRTPDWSFEVDDSINDIDTAAYPGTATLEDPTMLMLDFAEMRIASGGTEDRFANYRQTYEIPIDGSGSHPFFDGTGVSFKCDDVKKDKKYSQVRLFIRKMILNKAKKFYLSDSGNWSYDGQAEVVFREKDTLGLDFNQLMVNTYYDSLKENADDINRVFPLKIPIDGGLVYGSNDGEVVLEIRLVFKDFIKHYEYDYYDEEGRHAVYHFWGLSDWLRDVWEDDRPMGGNLLASARVYKPGETATVSGTSPPNSYIIAIPEENSSGFPQTIDDYFRDSTDSRRNRPAEYRPHSPYLPAENSIESHLDYYLQYEQYKVEYNTKFANVDNDIYKNNWNEYNSFLGELRVPPLVTWSDGTGNYELRNVPVGVSYNFYSVSGVPYGTLPDAEDCNIEDTATITGNTTLNM